jgi:hypothetical protein
MAAIPKERKGNFIPSGSTFMHEIILDPSLNNTDILTGYSKSQHYPEPANKVLVLKSVLYRIIPKYFERMMFLDVYIKNDQSKDYFVPRNRKHVLRIYKTYIETHNGDYVIDAYGFQDWLKNLLNNVGKKLPINELKPTWQRRKNVYGEILKAHMINRTFNTEYQVKRFCVGELKRGMPRDVLTEFYFNYLKLVLGIDKTNNNE